MGVDRAYVSGLELGERNPTVITLWHAAKALEVRVGALLSEPRGRKRSS
jgi:transcriptional regulator with XRE-family HTH domain